jgi:parallel beta-helix repeat protein
LVTSWSLYTGTTYEATVTIQPNRVWHGSTELTFNSGNKNSLLNNQFDWGSNVLYVNIGQNPAGETMEASQINWIVTINKSYIVIDGLHITKANNTNIASADMATNNVTIQNSTIDYAGLMGLYFGSKSAAIGTFVVQNNTISDNGIRLDLDHGIYLEHSGNNVIANNTFSNNAGYGVQIQDGSNNNAIEYNLFNANRTGAIVIWDNGDGLPTGNSIIYNVSNGDPIGLTIGGSTSTVSNSVYSNVFYGFTASGLKTYNSPTIGNFKNNILWSSVAGTYALDDEGGATSMASDYNIIGPEKTPFILWHYSSYTTLAAYKTVVGQDAHSISSDQKFTNPAGADFTLQAGSPAIGAGVYIPGVSTANPPNIGAK